MKIPVVSRVVGQLRSPDSKKKTFWPNGATRIVTQYPVFLAIPRWSNAHVQFTPRHYATPRRDYQACLGNYCCRRLSRLHYTSSFEKQFAPPDARKKTNQSIFFHHWTVGQCSWWDHTRCWWKPSPQERGMLNYSCTPTFAEVPNLSRCPPQPKDNSRNVNAQSDECRWLGIQRDMIRSFPVRMTHFSPHA